MQAASENIKKQPPPPPPFAPRKVGAFGPDQSPLLPLTPPHHTTTPHTPHTPHPFTCSFLSTPTNHHPNKTLVLLRMFAFNTAFSCMLLSGFQLQLLLSGVAGGAAGVAGVAGGAAGVAGVADCAGLYM